MFTIFKNSQKYSKSLSFLEVDGNKNQKILNPLILHLNNHFLMIYKNSLMNIIVNFLKKM